MADRIIQTETLQSIADAIRSKTATSDTEKIEVDSFALTIAQKINEFRGLINGYATVIHIPYGTTKIRKWAFYHMDNLGTTNIPTTVTSIDEHAYDYAKITSLTIPGSVNDIGVQALGNCTNLVQLILNEGITVLPNYFLYGCNKLPLIDIPESCNSIGTMAFRECSKLETVNIKNSNMVSIGTQAFFGIKSDAVINCAFSQGAVSGAPWGAPTGVTINYDVNFNS